jgi:hypothetical protein
MVDQLIKKFAAFMEPEYSLPCSQEPPLSVGYPKQKASNPPSYPISLTN